jgi:hypothetical protein
MIEMETDINRSIALDGEHLTLEQRYYHVCTLIKGLII